MTRLLGDLPSTLHGYVPAIRKVIVARTIIEMSHVFSRVTFKEFQRNTSVVSSFAEVDRIVSHLNKSNIADAKIDYLSETVRFTRSTQKQSLLNLDASSSSAVDSFQDTLAERVDSERKGLDERRVMIKRKQLELERRLEEADKLRIRKQKEAEELNRDAIKRKAEDDIKRRENEAREKARNARELEKAKELEARLRDDKIKVETLTSANKSIGAVVKELEKKLEAQNKKDKMIKLQQRKAEFKRVNLTAKVLRIEEAKRVATEFKPNVKAIDDAFFADLKNLRKGEDPSKKMSRQDARALLVPLEGAVESWRNAHLVARREEYQAKLQAARESFMKKHIREAIERSMVRLDTLDMDKDADYEEYEQISDVIRVDSNVSRDDFKQV